MQSVSKPWHHIPVSRAVPVLSEAERMEAKRREKMQSHASSHRFDAARQLADKASDRDKPLEVDRMLE